MSKPAHIKFPKELKEKIKAYANEYCEGNFSFAVRALCQGRLTELKGK